MKSAGFYESDNVLTAKGNCSQFYSNPNIPSLVILFNDETKLTLPAKSFLYNQPGLNTN